MVELIDSKAQPYRGQPMTLEEFSRLPKKYGNFAPDLVVEIISLTDRAGEIEAELPGFTCRLADIL